MSTLERARTAAGGCDWQAAYEAASAADDEGGLTGGDLELLAEAALWTGRVHDVFAAYQRGYAAHLAEGDRVRAGLVALRLASHYELHLQQAVASGWQERAARLFAAEPEAAEHGYLALAQAAAGWSEGRLDGAIELGAERAGDRAALRGP
jgi:hypothetical protein